VKVLIADDDLLVRTMLSDFLAELGHQVVAAANGAEAVALCARETPEVLVLDLLMPRLSGLDALKEMRQAGCTAPAVLLTAISDPSFREMEGAEQIEIRLDKPVTRRSLERALARAMSQKA
jgi:CheY-like chemotaxis protein